MRVDPKSVKRHWWLNCIFYTFGIYERKSCTYDVDEIDTRSVLWSKSLSASAINPLDQWFSTFFGQRHTFHLKFFCGTLKTRKILKFTSKNFYFCIKLLGFEICHTFATNHNFTCISPFLKQKWLQVGKSELK